jgi:hypothetical protein
MRQIEPLFDHLVGGYLQALRHREAKRLGGFEVDDQFEFRRLLDGQIGRLRSSEHFRDVLGRHRSHFAEIGAIGDETTGIDRFTERIQAGQALP